MAKIVDGHGDWLFYGHANSDQSGIESWWLIDLRAFRAALIRSKGGRGLRYGLKTNADGSQFVWFDIRSFPPAPRLIVAHGGLIGLTTKAQQISDHDF